MNLRVYLTAAGLRIEKQGHFFSPPADFQIDDLFAADDPRAHLQTILARSAETAALPSDTTLRAPMGSQEVWAAGVTYLRSRTARMEESKDAGGGTFYDKVYSAERPELFFKSTPHRVAPPGLAVRIRADSKWNVPEPELTLAVNHRGQVFGYTIGNDMSSRDIEGENPLYLPQAKVYDQSAALGPCLLVSDEPLPVETKIELAISRAGKTVFSGSTSLTQLKRRFEELAEFLFRDNSFPRGCYLMTGTGIVPPDNFTLHAGDVIRITILPIGTLENFVA